MKSSKLETAIRAGDLEKVRKLIAAGTDVAAAFADGTKPILLAARQGQITILRALAAAGADLADLEALETQERLKLFLDSALERESDDDLLGADELSMWAMQAVGERMDDKTAKEIAALEGDLFRAVRTGDVELLKERIAAGDDVNQIRDITRDTPLTLAVQYHLGWHEGGDREHDYEIMSELIAGGADVNHQGFSTPLSFALPNLKLAKFLIDAGADVYARGLDTQSALERAVHRALHPGSSADSPILVRFFLESGVHPPNAESVEGEMLMEAEYRKAWEVYQDLLPHYSEEVARESFQELTYSRDLKEHDGGFMKWTFDVNYAARNGEVEELRELLARPRDRDVAEVAKATGLAVKEALANLPSDGSGKAQLEAVRLLIDAGADLDAGEGYKDRRGSSPLAAAAESWHRDSEKALRLLLDAGAEVDQRGSYGRTPLMYAVLVAYRHGAALRKAVPVLLEAGADTGLEDEYGHTAWSLAKAPRVEEEERSRLGEALAGNEPFFDGPDLADLFSDHANKTDQRRSRLDRCREALELLRDAGAAAHGEADLRLMMAAAAGNVERVEELLAAGANADARGTDGRPAIVAAAQSGRSEVVERLIAAGCNVGASAVRVPSALEVAVRNADKAMTRMLLDAGANPVMMVALSSNDALAAAEAAGGTEVVEMIRASLPPELAHIDRDVEAEIAADDLTWESQLELPRHAALGDLDKVRELLAVEGVEVDGFDTLRRTALAAAAEAGRHEMVRELIAIGADVHTCNEVPGSPRSTPLVAAAIGPSAERDGILRRLLEAGADPDQLGADGRTALMHAVERDVGFFGRTGDFALSTRTLIEAGAALEIRDRYGLTAWMRAKSLQLAIDLDEVAEQYEAMARLLEEAGASKDCLTDVELPIAVMYGETVIVKELLAGGADPDARRHDGPTALILAARDGDRDLARLLIEAGSDVNAREWVDRGLTAMHGAVETRDRALVRVLAEAGADPVDEK